MVKDGYGKIAKTGTSCCGQSSCCGSSDFSMISTRIGYSDEDLKNVPEGANLGLGCGNPIALASLKKGEVVLDLGSGAGFDAFLASARVGKKGKVVGVDMTPEMLERARENAKKGGYGNVEFRLGEIESLPIEDNSVDVVISNCVINLSPDKQAVFKEAFRVIKPGGRLMVSDLVIKKALPAKIKESVEAYVGCLAGAIKKDTYIKHIKDAGFKEIEILYEKYYPVEGMANDPAVQDVLGDTDLKGADLKTIERSVLSIGVKGIKPL